MINPLKLRGWIRYDKQGHMIPGSLVLRDKKPSGRFKELVLPPTEVCCDYPIGTTTTTSTSSTTTTTTTAEPPTYIVYQGFEEYTTTGNLPPGAFCDSICASLNTLSSINLYSATPMGTEPTIGMQLFSDAGLTQEWPITYPNAGYLSVPPTSQYSSFGGDGITYFGFRVKWGSKTFALFMRGTAWIATPNTTPVTSYAVLDYRECSAGTCI